MNILQILTKSVSFSCTWRWSEKNKQMIHHMDFQTCWLDSIICYCREISLTYQPKPCVIICYPQWTAKTLRQKVQEHFQCCTVIKIFTRSDSVANIFLTPRYYLAYSRMIFTVGVVQAQEGEKIQVHSEKKEEHMLSRW